MMAVMRDDNPWLARRVLGFAHRGGALEYPENTLHAFRGGLAAGAHALELDVHATADGHLVVSHDARVDRTTDGTGAIAELSLAEIRELDAAAHFVPGVGTDPAAPARACPLAGVARGADTAEGIPPEELRIPTLREVLTAFPDAILNMEVKNGPPHVPSYVETLAGLLAEFGRDGDVIVAAFEDAYLADFRRHAPDIPTAMTSEEVAAFRRSGATPPRAGHGARPVAVQIPRTYGGRELLTPALVDAAHAHGHAVHVWIVDEPAEIRELVDLGVDGIMSDRPSVLARVLRESGAAWSP